MNNVLKSPVVVALSLETVVAGVGLWSQWFGAWYAKAHGLSAWRFGLRSFLLTAFLIFCGIGITALSASDGGRSRLILGIGSAILYVVCIYGGFYLWLNIYGS